MNDDDIQRALNSEPRSEPSPALLERALTAGAARRRRRMWVAGSLAAAMLLIGGVAVASVAGGDDETVVGVQPTAVPDSAMPVIVAPSISRPHESSDLSTDEPADPSIGEPVPSTTSTEPTTLASATTSTTSSIAVTTTTTVTSTTVDAADPTTTLASPTTAPLFVGPPCPASMVPDQRLVVLVADGAPPADDAFLVSRSDDDVDPSQWITELWTRDRRWGSVRFGVPDGYWQCFGSTSVIDYDGRWLWIAITSDPSCQCTQRSSVLVRADMTNGELRTMWRTIGTQNVMDVLPDGDGGALVLTGPGDGAPFVALYDVAATDEGSNEAPIDAWNARRPDTTDWDIGVGEIAPDRSHVAYAWSDAFTGTVELYLDRVGPPGLEVVPTPIDLSHHVFFVVDVDWSADSTRLLLQHDYEGLAAFTLDVDAADPLATLDHVGAQACDLPDGSLVTADWSYVVDGPPVPTDIVLQAGGQSSVVAASVDGRDLVCLPSGHVLWEQFDSETGLPSYRIADQSGTMASIDIHGSSDEWPIIHRW